MKTTPPKFHNDKFIYGIHPVLESLNSDTEIEKVILQQGLKGEWIPGLRKTLAARNIPLQILPSAALDRMIKGNHQGVAAIVSPLTYQLIENILPGIYESGQVPLLLILDQVTDVRNAGAIARTALSCGVHAMIVPARGSAQLNADAVKTSAGALLTLPVVRSMNLKSTMRFLKDSGLTLIAASEKSSLPPWKADFSIPLAILVGSEEHGISPEYLKLCDLTTGIPVTGPVGSFNVSAASAMILYEVIRQRKGS